MKQRSPSKDVVFGSDTLASFKRVAVVRSLEGLGDFLCLIPALRSLRAALPQAQITLVGMPKTQMLVQRFHQYIDILLAFPGYPGLPEQMPQPQKFPAFLAAAQNQRFDLALQLHGNGIITNPLTVLLDATHTAGFFLSGQYCPQPDCFLPYVHDESEVRRYIRLMDFLGFPSQGEALEFPLYQDDYQAMASIEATYSLRQGRYVCMHPGASMVDRRWSPKRFAIVADALAQRGYQIVLTGSAEEVPLTQAVARFMHAASINVAGCTNLGALAVLLKGACLLVCNDTGVSHLAAALQVPSVVIFTASDPKRWSPLDGTRHRVVDTTRGETLEDAIAQAETLLQQSSVSSTRTSTASKMMRHEGASA
ncbi:MAG: glycosyltransferase family 9 protein [Lyngbya sp. HA4199-MV5]|jgi:ADP-heptose:LPS heptosyltransferase|nr:glycosyltransferase family 9 protein [Lyngbya sp. HA4199-MV5]